MKFFFLFFYPDLKFKFWLIAWIGALISSISVDSLNCSHNSLLPSARFCSLFYLYKSKKKRDGERKNPHSNTNTGFFYVEWIDLLANSQKFTHFTQSKLETDSIHLIAHYLFLISNTSYIQNINFLLLTTQREGLRIRVFYKFYKTV